MLGQFTLKKAINFLVTTMKNLMSRFPEIRELQSIVAVHQTGSFTKAALALGTNQSTLSYLIERLRQRLDDPLFVRVGNRMEPTPYAERLARSAESILEVVSAELQGIEQFDPYTTRREFRIVLTEVGAITLLPKIVKRLNQDAPHASLAPLHAKSLDLEAALSEGRADIAVGTYNELKGDQNLFQQLLLIRDYVLIVREDHPTIGEDISTRTLASTPQVANAVASDSYRWMEDHLASQGLGLNVALTLEHAVAIPMLVGASDFIALVSRELYDIFRVAARVREVRLPFELPQAHIRQHWHPRVHHDPAVTFLRKLVRDVAQATEAQPWLPGAISIKGTP